MTFPRSFAAPIAAALLLAGCGPKTPELKPDEPVAAVAPPAGTEWTDQVARTERGGFVMGNPNAPVKLIEYASFTCPHCRDFTAAAAEPLKADFIKSGKVSWEFRPFLLSGADVAPTLLAECQGPAPFFTLAEQLYAQQSTWVAPLVSMTEAERTRLGGLPPAQQFKAIAETMGLPAFFRQRGVPQAKIDQCLADTKAADALAEQAKRATEEDKITGTPSFLINGVLQDNVVEWPALRAKLTQAIGG